MSENRTDTRAQPLPTDIAGGRIGAEPCTNSADVLGDGQDVPQRSPTRAVRHRHETTPMRKLPKNTQLGCADRILGRYFATSRFQIFAGQGRNCHLGKRAALLDRELSFSYWPQIPERMNSVKTARWPSKVIVACKWILNN